MNKPQISVIVPVYNAASYLEQCIRSIFAQSFSDLEIIAVNDGSTDASAALLDQLAATDKRLHVFHRPNMGVSAARNFGIKHAAGAYIGFSDADDFMEPTMLQELHSAVTANNCDWAICNVNMLRESEPVRARLLMTDEVLEVSTNRASFVHGLMRFHYDNANWNKLFSASIIHEHHLLFTEGMQVWEDLLFNLRYLNYVNRIAVLAKPLYNYRILSSSLFAGYSGKLIPQFNTLYHQYLAFAQQHAGDEEIKAFKQETARIVYYDLLYRTELDLKQQSVPGVSFYRLFRETLNRFDPTIFYYPAAMRKGFQGFKQWLLHTQRFGLFAFIISMKPWLRRPYRFLRRYLR